MSFDSLLLCEPLLRSLQATGYREPTAIQQKAIPKLLTGRDLIGCAQTGTGKTAAFVLPTLQRLMETSDSSPDATRQRSGRRTIRALILAPTRELAAQIGESLDVYGKHATLRQTVIFGGVRQGNQVRALRAGVDILVATPGRLLDLIQQGFIDLGTVEILILDEADQMLDMGFIHDLRKIVSRVPDTRQTLMFSATMPQQIRDLAKQWLRRPFEVRVAPVASTPELVSQAVCFVERRHKAATLTRYLTESQRSRTLVFSRTKRGADKIVRGLQRDGIRAIAIHGNKSQARREAAMREFNSNRPPVLVATDLAARGLDFSDISHVINYDLPDTPETYVHRIGRTARAGASGQAISFCGGDERHRLRMIERLTGQAVSIVELAGPSSGGTAEASDTEKRGNARRGAESPANGNERRPKRGSGPNRSRRSGGLKPGGRKGTRKRQARKPRSN